MNQQVIAAVITALSGATVSAIVRWIVVRFRKTRRANLRANAEAKIRDFQRSKDDVSRPRFFRRCQASTLRDELIDAIYTKPFHIGFTLIMFVSWMVFMVSYAFTSENPNDSLIAWWQATQGISFIAGVVTLLRMITLTIGRETLRSQLEQPRKRQGYVWGRRHIAMRIARFFACNLLITAPSTKEILELRKQLEVH